MRHRLPRLIATAAAGFVWLSPAGAQHSSPPSIGAPAPQLTVEEFLDPEDRPFEPTEFDWAAFRGKVVIVEFSASWCIPCIAAIPHMQALGRRFQGQPVEFWTVTNDPPEKAALLRNRHGLRSPIALDPDGSTFWDYWVESIPLAAVIDPRGNIAALTDPMQIDAEAISELLAGGTIDLPLSNPNPSRTSWAQSGTEAASASAEEREHGPLALVSITPVDTAGFRASLDRETGRISIPGFPLRLLIRVAFAGRPHLDNRVQSNDEEFFAAEVIPPDCKLATARTMLASVLTETFDLEVRQEDRTVPVHQLRVRAGANPILASEATSPDRSVSPGSIEMTGTTSADLAKALSRVLHSIVLDDTGLHAPFDIAIEWDAEDDASIAPALAELGFELIEDEAEIEFTVIEMPARP